MSGTAALSNDIDPVLLEVVKNGFDTIADEMALILMRTAYSSIARDSMDYSTAICDAQGRTLAQGLTLPMHLGSFPDAMRHLINRYRGRVDPGDVFIANDPYVAAGQHLPDIYIIKPIFLDVALIGWATTIAHQADVGGIIPGSNSIGATEIYQEGLRLPALKLYEQGRRNDAIWEIIETNVRVPDKVLGDLRAQLASCTTGEREFTELVRRHGIPTMARYIEALHDYAEALARQQITGIPDGVYAFTDHIDGLGEAPEPIVLKVKVEVRGDRVHVDWAGTSAQVPGGINAPLSFTKSNVYAALRSIMSADVPNCEGYTRPITVTAPEGTLVNVRHPGACGARGITGYRIVDCMFGALIQAVPERLTADSSGGSTLPTFAGYQDGKPFVFTECVLGPWGAAPGHDGQDGVPHMAANMSNVPVEFIEADYPLRVEQYGLVADTGGPGRHRGGLSLIREYRVLADRALVSVRSDKRTHPPHGAEGGLPGGGSTSIVNPGRGERVLPVLMTEPIMLAKGDVLRHVMAGGGGYGDPYERDPAHVLEDIVEGRVTPEHARTAYGVAIVGGETPGIDRAETARLRQGRSAADRTGA